MNYRVDLPRRQQPALDRLPPADRARLSKAIFELGAEPRPRGVKRLSGSALWRIRIGEYRVIFTIGDRARVVTITDVKRRTTTTYD